MYNPTIFQIRNRMFEWIFSLEMWLALGTLSALEIVLGIAKLLLLPF